MAYSELLPHLIRNSLVVPYPTRPLEPPYPKGYYPNAKCDYHAGATGHSTDNCLAFKYKIQDLLKAGWINFKENNPNVGDNPLPGHGGSTVNVVEEHQELIRDVEKIKMPLKIIFSELYKAGMIEGGGHEEDTCCLHPGANHHIEECTQANKILQKLMDMNWVQVGYIKEKVAAIQSKWEEDMATPKPVVIHFTKSAPPSTLQGATPITIPIPGPFPYKDTKAVPWKYDAKV